ncbi:glycosyltransferase family 2 protein [Streptomyces lasiicapitis]|uniref:glycosyltransferase family 2 protein n=1 Tax=Streptomyces lasiicapitis TaxID=1923961 RepID=UPI0036D0365B
MPRFSVVVPAHRVQGYLRECLESVLDQSFGDLELIVVDDASPDACAAIAAEYAQRDLRVQLVRRSERRGVGPARDAGAARATGEWLLFLDGDDVLLPGALAALDAALTPDVDVLLFGHDRTDWWETVRRPVGEDVTGDPHAVTVAAWNRLFRRSFWSERGLVFSLGAYEDVVPVRRATLLAGERVGSLDRACVRWRERRGGSFAKSPGREHFAVVGRYEELFAEGPEVTEKLFPYAADHLLAVLDDPGRVVPGDRSAYFRAAAAMLRAHRPSAYTPMTDRQRVLLSASYGTYRALSRAGGRMKALRTALARRKKSVRARAMRVSYRADLRRSLDPRLAVYGAYWNRGVSCNPAAIHAKARELAPHIRGVWVVGGGRPPPPRARGGPRPTTSPTCCASEASASRPTRSPAGRPRAPTSWRGPSRRRCPPSSSGC